MRDFYLFNCRRAVIVVEMGLKNYSELNPPFPRIQNAIAPMWNAYILFVHGSYVYQITAVEQIQTKYYYNIVSSSRQDLLPAIQLLSYQRTNSLVQTSVGDLWRILFWIPRHVLLYNKKKNDCYRANSTIYGFLRDRNADYLSTFCNGFGLKRLRFIN